MDPNATMSLMTDALNEGDYDTAREAARNLLEWVAKGGWWPEYQPEDVQALLNFLVNTDTD